MSGKPRIVKLAIMPAWAPAVNGTTWIVTLVGDLQRVIEYPKLGFAIAQDVPEDVYAAFKALVAAGFDSRLLTA